MVTVLGRQTNVFLLDTKGTEDNLTKKVLVVGIKDVAGTQPSGVLAEEINLDIANIKTLFGSNSHITQKLLAYYNVIGDRVVDRKPLISVFAVDNDVAGTPAEATLTITNNATKDTFLQLYAGDKQDYLVSVNILKNETPTQIGDKIVSAFNSLNTLKQTLPITAINNAGIITFASTFKSTIANDLQLSYLTDLTDAGFTITLTKFTGGSGTYDVSSLTNAIEDLQFDIIDIDNQLLDTATTDLYDFVNSRKNTQNNILSGLLFTAIQNTYNNILSTFHYQTGSNLKAKNNSLFAPLYFALKTVNDTANAFGIFPTVGLSRFIAQYLLTITEGADITGFMSANFTDRGGFVGNIKNSPVDMPLPSFGNVFVKTNNLTKNELINLRDNCGGMFLEVEKATGGIKLSTAYTTFKVDADGNLIGKKAKVEFIATSLFIQKFAYNYIKDNIPAEATYTTGFGDGIRIFNRSDIIKKLQSIFTTLSNANYSILSNNESILLQVRNKIAQTFKFTNGDIVAGATAYILPLIESITINILPEFDN